MFMLNLLTEFRRHRSITNPVHIIGFLSQWKMYLDELPATNFTGKKLDPTVFEKVSLLTCYPRWPMVCQMYTKATLVYVVDVRRTIGTVV